MTKSRSTLMIAVLALGFLANSQRAGAATAPTIFSEKIAEVRQQILAVEQSLISGLKTQKEARDNVKKIQQLLKLQAKELTLGKQRVGELERTISALEIRRGELREKIGISQNRVRKNLQKWIHASREVSIEIELTEHERLEPAHAYVLKNMARLGIREITLLKADLADAEQLEGKIQEEQTQLAYLFQDLKEQESILELNKKLQFDVLQKKHEDRLSQLEKYRQLKDSELKVDGLISDFNAKVELKKTIVVEKEAARSLSRGDFAQNRGRLSWPVVGGTVIQGFGRTMDLKSGLFVFKKGVDIAVKGMQEVKAIFSGKIAFAGDLPEYGRVTIIDHGDHYYSLAANLGETRKKTGDQVLRGEVIGYTDRQGTALYFEIRTKNIPVNPASWVN